ncbi:MAG: methyltransferase type 12 [Frankiales bacterium]|nr:methyltransferase type 12 [Frankiales bacterium]
MTIVPDRKDWIWVLQRPCPECGFDARGVERAQVPARTREVATALAGLLSGADPTWARGRPGPDRWAPVEYGCHVRDVFRIFDERLRLMIETEGPLFANWDQDATAAEEDYLHQDPATVAAQLVAAAEQVAGRFGAVQGEQWSRPGRRSDGARFTVDSFARYFLHDPVHHLWDVRR